MRILPIYHGKIPGKIHWRMHKGITACGISMSTSVSPNYGPITCRECWSQLRTTFGEQVKFNIRAIYENGMTVNLSSVKAQLGPYKTLQDAEEAVISLRKQTRAWKSELQLPSKPIFDIYVDMSDIAESDLVRMSSKKLFWSPEINF